MAQMNKANVMRITLVELKDSHYLIIELIAVKHYKNNILFDYASKVYDSELTVISYHQLSRKFRYDPIQRKYCL